MTEEALDQALRDASEEARRLFRISGSRFLQMLNQKGAIRTCVELAINPEPSEGLKRLYRERRVDLSLEAIIQKSEFRDLFSPEVLKSAARKVPIEESAKDISLSQDLPITQVFRTIYERYSKERETPFPGNPLASFVRNEVPEIFRSVSADLENINWIASAGKGNWADAPWIGALDTIVTDTPEDGYYVVYLFDSKIQRVYLSLNQGMTRIKAERKSKLAIEILRHRASLIRQRLKGEDIDRFELPAINLDPPNSSHRLKFYEPGHSFGKEYVLGDLPSEETLQGDLSEMLRLYLKLTYLGGVEELDTIENSQSDSNGTETHEEKLRLRAHFMRERNSNLSKRAKEIHGYVCQVCGFDFRQVYGVEYIEAHHLVPLAELDRQSNHRLSPKDDFAVVCANCHRMIHRTNAPENFEEFRNSYLENKKNLE